MLVVVSLHWMASLQGLYWSLDWYDVMMHFLGGLWTAFFALWAWNTPYALKCLPYFNKRNLLIFVFVVGFSWEAHEIVLGFTSHLDREYWPDTTQDFIFDMAGALVGAFIYRRSIPVK